MVIRTTIKQACYKIFWMNCSLEPIKFQMSMILLNNCLLYLVCFVLFKFTRIFFSLVNLFESKTKERFSLFTYRNTYLTLYSVLYKTYLQQLSFFFSTRTKTALIKLLLTINIKRGRLYRYLTKRRIILQDERSEELCLTSIIDYD